MEASRQRAIIVADGPSAAGFKPPEGVSIFAVKGAINWLDRADFWFSLDPNHRTRAMMEIRRPGVRYACAVPPGCVLPPGVERLERVQLPRFATHPRQKYTPEWWCWRWDAVPTLSTKQGKINTGNSAWGALGWAYLLGYRDVLLVGVDGTSEPRVSDNVPPKDLQHLPYLFESALPQLTLASVSSLGKVPRVTLEEWLNACPRY